MRHIVRAKQYYSAHNLDWVRSLCKVTISKYDSLAYAWYSYDGKWLWVSVKDDSYVEWEKDCPVCALLCMEQEARDEA